MDSIPTATLATIVRELFTEAYEGATGLTTWFVDNEPGTGLLGTLAGLTAEQASTPSVEGGSTVAAHTEHLRWSLSKANAFVRGETPSMDWADSWAVRGVDEAAWARLRGDLEAEFRILVASVEAVVATDDPRFLTGVFAAVPHAAYHLGAVRQMAKVVGG